MDEIVCQNIATAPAPMDAITAIPIKIGTILSGKSNINDITNPIIYTLCNQLKNYNS